MIPALDFETYSEAGYVFDTNAGRFMSPMGKGKKAGLQIINAPVYAEHPRARLISLAYNLNDGCGTRLWTPVDGAPQPLFNYIHTGAPIEAHNSAFEYYIWFFVCQQRMGWPDIPLEQFRCSAAKARAWGLPGSLEKAGMALDSDQIKDPRGKQLIRLLSVPKKPTKNDAMWYRTPEKYPELYQEMYDYNIQDVDTEQSISGMCPDLSEQELKVWMLDQRINARGVQIDTKALDACLDLYQQAERRYTDELISITNGVVQGVGEITKNSAGDKWLQEQGINTPSLDKQSVEDMLSWTHLPPAARRVLEIRQLIGGSSVKKLFAMQRHLNSDGRIRDLFVYCGAGRTGRWAGRGPQPQNLKSGGPSLNGREWCYELAEEALSDIHTGNLETIENKWGSAVELIGSCLRSLFIPAPGHDFICSDYSAIEAVVAAAIAGEEWRLEVFNTHGKIYEASASMAFGVPLEEILEHKARTGEHHPLRKKGKVAELACFGSDTKILTDKGWKKIAEVKNTDRIFDGCDFVNHSGVMHKGKKLTTKMGGVTVTLDHKFYLGENKWATTENLKQNTHLLKEALSMANLLLSVNKENLRAGLLGIGVCVLVDQLTDMSRVICDLEKAPDVQNVVLKKQEKRLLFIQTYALIKNIVEDLITAFVQPLKDVLIQTTGNIGFMAVEVLPSIRNGLKIDDYGLNILCLCQGGTIQKQRLTESITIKDMCLGILDLSVLKNNRIINSKLFGLNIKDKKCQQQNFIENIVQNMLILILLPENLKKDLHQNKLLIIKNTVKDRIENVYDILNCGPNNRFVIKTDYGPLIAHNSGYGGWVGAWKNFGATGTDDEIKADVLAWRDRSPNIVETWGGQWRKTPGRWHFTPELYGIEGSVVSAISNPDTYYEYRGIGFGVNSREDVLYIRLPSGRDLVYHKPRLNRGTDPRGLDVWQISYMGIDGYTGKWGRIYSYGPKFFENIVQAASRDILARAMLRLEAAGYPIVLHVHDEATAEIPEGFGSVEEFEKIMMVREPWFADWPIRAAGGWRGKRFRK